MVKKAKYTMRFPNELVEVKQVCKRLQQLFAKSGLESLAASTGFVQRSRKLTGHMFALLCMQGVSREGLAVSLNELCGTAGLLGVQLVAQSLNERFNERAVTFMEQVFGTVVGLRLGQSALETLPFFSGIYLEDATVCQLPERLGGLFKGSGGGASRAGIKINGLFDIKFGQWKVRFKDAASADNSTDLLAVPAGSLWLRDLGYFRLADFERIGAQKAWYVSRLAPRVSLYRTTDPGCPAVDLLRLSRSMKEGQAFDLPLFMGKQRRMPVRLVIQRVPQKVADMKRHRLRKAARRKRWNITKERLEMCNLNLFITNLPTGRWSAQQVMSLYTIRWQIEIMFKVWKSIFKIGKPGPMNPHRFLCLLYGQMAWAVLNAKIFHLFKTHFWNNDQVELSELKGFKILRCMDTLLKAACTDNRADLFKKYLYHCHDALQRLAMKQRYKNNRNKLFQ